MRIKYHKLTDNEKDIIEFAAKSGYFNMQSILLAFPNWSYNNTYAKLKVLIEKEYISVFKIGGSGNSVPNVYKITPKTGHFLNMQKSYKLKEHKDEYAQKKIIESRFVGRYFSNFRNDIVTEHHDKLKILESYGYEKDHFPTKIGNLIFHIEELIFVNSDNHSWMNESEFCFIGTDDIFKNIDAQARAILKKYQALVAHRPIKFIIISDDPRRVTLWNNYFDSLVRSKELSSDSTQPIKLRSPDISYVSLYLEFIKKYREIAYVDLIKRLNCSTESVEVIIAKTSEYIKKNVIVHKPEKEMIELIASLEFNDFISLIKKTENENPLRVKQLFMTAFLIQVIPDISKLALDEIDIEIAKKFNFGSLLV